MSELGKILTDTLATGVLELKAEIERLRARLREQTDETQHAGERIDAAICGVLGHVGIDISDRVGTTPIEQIVGGVVVGLQAEVERLRAVVADDVAKALMRQPVPPEEIEWARQITKRLAALAAGGEGPPP